MISKLNMRLMLLFIIILGTSLDMYNLEKGLWIDEAFSIRDSELPLSSIIHITHPLYYAFLHFFLNLGKGEFILRLPSVLLGILAILLTYKIGKSLFGAKEGLISAFLLSISPMHIRYSQEIRMYALFEIFSLLSLFFFYKSLKENDLKFWIGFIITTILNIFAHPFAFFVIFIEILYLFLFRNKHRDLAKKLAFGLFIFLIFLTPKIILLYHAFSRLMISSPTIRFHYGIKPGLHYILNVLGILSGGNMLSFPFLFFVLFGFLPSIKKRQEEVVLLAMWIIIPTFLFFLIAFKLTIWPRYFIFILPIFLIVVSKGVSEIKSNQLLVIILVGIAVMNGYYINNYYNVGKPEWRAASNYLKVNFQKSDIVIVEPDWDRTALTNYGIKDGDILGVRGIEPIIKIRDIAEDYDRVWIVLCDYYEHPPPQKEVQLWTERNCNKEKKFKWLSVYLCEHNSN